MKETVRELHDALEKLRRGQHEEIDAIRMLELFELLTAAHQGYWGDGRADRNASRAHQAGVSLNPT